MLILAADTSGKQGSVALARGQADRSCDLIEDVPLAGGTFSAQLVPQIAALLAKHGFTKNDIEAFAAASGPGSFTGLRVGLAAIKALAEVLQKPIAAVSLLEVLAVTSGLRGKVIAALDAGRTDVYVGQYEVSDDSAQFQREQLLSRAEFLLVARDGSLVTPDGPLAEAVRAEGSPCATVQPLSAGSIARLGWRKLREGKTVSPDQLEANYIRRSDAEIFGKVS